MAALRTIFLTGLGVAALAASGLDASAPKPAAPAPAAQAPISDEQATARANALIAQMTVEEKVGQLIQLFTLPVLPGADSKTRPDQPGMLPPPDDRIRAGQVGSLLFVADPAEANRLQRIAMTQSRLKIPLIFGLDVIHGLRTIFPVPIGMAASFDPDTVRRAQAVAAREARAVGVDWTFAPMLDIARDPRWGRIVEGAGEDPFLGAAMARAQVQGFQGPYIGAPGHIIAGAKHFVGYGASPGGRDYDSVFLSDAELHNVYLPPFAAAVDAGVGNVMSAYMDLNDIPASGNRWLLTDVLRGEFGFKGWVVSDAGGVNNQVKEHFAADPADAAIRAITAGNDMEMALYKPAFATLVQSVESGKVPVETLDRSVRRILVAKIRMGLFEHPYVDEAAAKRVLADPAHRATAEQAAERALVLLRNQDDALPLKPGAAKRVAVIGPLANSPEDTLGPWAFFYDRDETVTVFDGVRDRLGAKASVETAPGVQLHRLYPSGLEAFQPPPPVWSAGRAKTELAHAVDLARNSDLVILTLGEARNQSGERASVSTLKLPGDQLALFNAVAATGKPFVVVLINGRPLDLTGIADRSPAILEAWFPGTRGGAAIARALFGDVDPGGKLPITWPRDVGQVPIYYAHNRTQSPETQDQRYYNEPSSPLYPFGYGLSYTTFSMTPPTVDRPALEPGGKVVVSTVVTNTGTRKGDEVVQLYIHQRAGRASRPVRQLRGFERVTLAPGGSRKLSFTLDEASVRYWNAAERGWVIDPGVFDIWVGPDSTASLHTTFTVGGAPRAAPKR